MANSAGIDYLREVLRLDPLDDAERMLALRANWLAGGTAEAMPDDEAGRRRAGEALERLRREFWALDDAELRRRLDDFDERRFPELSVALARLRAVASQRQALLDLSDPTGPAAAFTEELRRVLIAPMREAAQLREANLAAIGEANAQRREPGIQAVQRMIARMADRHPELYLLEEEWLTAVARIGGDRPGWIIRAWRTGVPRFLMALLLALLLFWWAFMK